MKKILFLALMLSMTAAGFTSCSDDEEFTDSRITYYPVLEIQGDDFVQVPIGTAYNEQGCKATLNGEDYSSNVVTSGTVDASKAGLYYITYTATNADGFSVSATRTVAVCDPTIATDMSGTYTLQAGSHRDSHKDDGSVVTTAFSGYTVKVTKAAPGIFYVSDMMGGYYDQKAGYGSNYAMTGYFQLLADNSLVLLSSSVAGWGDSATGFKDGKYDPATGEISYVVNYATSMDFVITLK